MKLTARQSSILDYLKAESGSGRLPTMTATALAFSVTVPTMSDHFAALVRKGLLRHAKDGSYRLSGACPLCGAK